MKLKREQLMAGRRLLQRLLPEAMNRALDTRVRGEIATGVAAAMQHHLTIEKLDAVVIHEVSTGGWHVDIILRGMPPGISNVLGTAVLTPLASRQQAQAQAPLLLAYVVKLALDEKRGSADPVFDFHGCEITLPAMVLQKLLDAGFAESGYSQEQAVCRLAELEAEMFPGGFSVEKFDTLSDDHQRRLYSVMSMAAALGIFRYPEWQPTVRNPQAGCTMN